MIRKQSGDIKDTYDLVLLPPISIKNCLPCSFEVMTSHDEDGVLKHENPVKENYLNEQSGTYHFEKEDQKHFHNMGYYGLHKDEIGFKFKVNGYMWTQVLLKKRQSTEQEDKLIKVRDIDGIVTELCLRIMHTKAGYQLIFYAYTVILNQSSIHLTYFFNTINKSVLAG